ncbi:cysteine dioxygenase family protein [Micromonospora sp. NPDC126480]|uniref:cysteine dioxygenase n=1 Tax=Micromonospora sp. NPDC126480 TaxID=3155312 RepID=UPI0033186F0F
MNPVELIEAVRETKRRNLPQRESLAALSTALSEFVADPANRRVSLPATTRGLYTRMLLNARDDDFQIVVVSWSPRSASPIHDHSGTVGAVAALAGTTIETKHRIVGTEGGSVRLQRLDTLRLTGRTVTPILPDEEFQLHDMVNATDERAATVHIYLTPVNDFFIYEPQPDGTYRLQPRRLWFDVENAWQLWTKGTVRHVA